MGTPAKPKLLKSGATFWWILGLVIAVPALILALLGLRAVRSDQVEREQTARRQQRQVAQLSDASLTTMLSNLDSGVRQATTDSTGSWYVGTADAFTHVRYEQRGLIVFPASKTYFGEIGKRPAELDALTQWMGSVTVLIEQAQGAEVQGRRQEAMRLYERIAQEEPELKVWAELGIGRLKNPNNASLQFRTASIDEDGVYRALTPTGLPVALLASNELASIPASDRRAYLPQIQRVIQHLRDGSWWLSYSERQFYHSLLQRLTAETDTDNSVQIDDRLVELTSIEAALRLSTPTRRDGPTHAYVSNDRGAFLIIWSPSESESGMWNGIALNQAQLDARLDEILSPLLFEQPFESELRDASNSRVWGSLSIGTPELQRVSSRVVREWEYVFSVPVPTSGRSDVVSYGVIALLVIMMLSGLAVTVRGVRQEMELGKLQNEFVSAVSHEFKSPITGVRLLMERLSTGRNLTSEQTDQYFVAIDSELNRLERLVNRVLTMQKLQTGRLPYRFTRTSITDLIEHAVSQIRPQAEAKQIRIVFESDEKSTEVELDESAITDAMKNLLDNAIKYSPNGSLVSVRTECKEEFVVVNVSDEGPGISSEESDRIFERFYRGAAADQHDVRGTGLGLALVRAVVEDHNGSVNVTRSKSGGSCFRMTLPISQSESDHA